MTSPTEQVELEFSDAKPEYQAKRALWVVLVDLLKYAYLADVWEKDNRQRTAIRNHRYVIYAILRENPEFKEYLEQEFAGTYADARETAVASSGDYNPDYPAESPWSLEQVLDEDYLPVVAQQKPLKPQA